MRISLAMSEKSLGRIGVGRLMLVSASAAVLAVACGSEPKKEPAAATATAPVETPPAPAPPTPAEAATAPADAADAGGTAKPDKQAECRALVDEANSALDAERIAVDKQCKKDADCVPIKARACGFACTTGAVPEAQEKEWNETVKKAGSARSGTRASARSSTRGPRRRAMTAKSDVTRATAR